VTAGRTNHTQFATAQRNCRWPWCTCEFDGKGYICGVDKYARESTKPAPGDPGSSSGTGVRPSEGADAGPTTDLGT
jgi:hypothetical protein